MVQSKELSYVFAEGLEDFSRGSRAKQLMLYTILKFAYSTFANVI
jgi:hypothetical protein